MKNLCVYLDNTDMTMLCKYLLSLEVPLYRLWEGKHYSRILTEEAYKSNDWIYIFLNRDYDFSQVSFGEEEGFIEITPSWKSFIGFQPGGIGVISATKGSELDHISKLIHRYVKNNYVLSDHKSCYSGPHMFSEWQKGNIVVAGADYEFASFLKQSNEQQGNSAG